ncbi:MAG: AAA domain-containing protein, partial [Candidatus Nanopelagicales bacterium]
MSERVRQILGGPPTPAQLRAIDLAINSRDVVLIQGPPGTGKTRVIAAIQARLTEINAHMPAIARRVLLTSYQHDAVSNLILAADDGQLPPVKLGAASELDDDGYLVAWTHDLNARLEYRYANVPGHALVAQQRALRDRIEAYQLQPFDLLSTADLLEWFESNLELVGATVVLDARRLGRELAHDVARSSVTAQADVLRLARGLRVTRDGFDDDGPAAANRARRSAALMALLTSDDAVLLTQVATGVGSDSSEQTLDALARVRRTLIDVVLDARARANVLAAMPAVSALLQRAQAAAQESVDERTSPIERTVARFRDAVEHQPSALRMSLQTHTRALAATCQQSVSTSVKSAQPVLFNTVIIDEAARANPLDLMIPISLAQERVILVGDHRQLPQLLDDAIAPKLSSRHDPKIVDETLQKSLFERLFRQLKAVEGQGSEPRVVTLDTQFRMHPHLGDFVNRAFYAPFGESLSNADPNPSSFQHGLSRYGTAACGWIHVPHVRGGEQRTNTSIRRPAEAAAVVQELYASLEGTGKQTFGVITFYSAQRIAIWEAMLAAGLAVRAGDQHGLNPSIDWLFDARGLPRVRIGSVDAF